MCVIQNAAGTLLCTGEHTFVDRAGGELHAALRSGIREAARIQKVLSGEDMLEVEDEPATSSYMLRGDPTPSKLQVAVAVSTAKQAGGGAKAAGKGRKRKVGRGDGSGGGVPTFGDF